MRDMGELFEERAPEPCKFIVPVEAVLRGDLYLMMKK
jgi:hypothetical protein